MNLRLRPTAHAVGVLLASAALLATGPVRAADRTWDGNGADATWSFGAATGGNTNWTHIVVPGQQPLANGDHLIFAGSTRLANVNDYANLSVAGMLFKAGAGAFTLAGNALASTDDIVNTSTSRQRLSFANLVVGADQVWNGGSAGLTIDNFTLDRHALELSGTVELRSSATNTVIGRTQAAELRAGAGSTVATGLTFLADQAGSSGRVRLDAGARWTAEGLFYVGTRGAGELMLTRGSLLASEGGHVGRFAGSSGTASIDADSRWLASGHTVRVGYGGTGTLAVQGTLHASTLSLGFEGGRGSFALAGSQALLSSDLFLGRTTLSVGGDGYGSALFADRSNAFLRQVTIRAPDAGSDGLGSVLRVSGGATVESDDIRVGAHARLRVESGGRLDMADLYVGFDAPGLANPGTATVDVVGGRLAADSINVGAGQASLLSIGSGAQLVVANHLVVNPRGRLLLDGGSVSARSLILSEPTLLDWRRGHLTLDAVDIGAGSGFGSVLVVPADSILQARSVVSVLPGSVLLLSQPGAVLRASGLSLDGGTVVGPLSLAEVRGIGGHGTVLGRVAGGSGSSSINVHGGDLSLGTLALADAVALGTKVLVFEDRTLLLLSANEAQLGPNTRLQDGARLVTVNGAVLGAGEVLETPGFHARVQGRFVNNGTVQALARGSITFEDDVSGSGSFSGRIVFSDGFTPGAGSTSFGGGDVVFDASSELAIPIGPSGEGRLVDIAGFSLGGSLLLNFDAGFEARAAGGLRLDLLDFQRWAGGFDLAQVQVQGFDRSRLDFSQFALDGSIAVAAVPEPGSWVLTILGGLGLAIWRGAVAGRRR